MQSGGGTTTTNQKADPWSGAQPFLTDLMSKAQQTYDASQGQTSMPAPFVGPSAQTQQALGLTTNRAMNGSPLVNAADQSLTGILGQNPNATPGNGILNNLADPNSQANQAASFYANPQNFNAQFSALSKPVIDSVNAQAGLAGRTGSGAQQQLLTSDLGDLSGRLYSDMANRSLAAGGQLAATQGSAASQLAQNYNSANQQKLGAALQSPNLAAQDYTDLQNLLNVGGAYDQQNQTQQNNLLRQFQYAQQQPWNILSGYAGAISGLGGMGGSQTGSTTQPSQSALPQLAGTALSILPFLL